MIITKPGWYDRETTPYGKIRALKKYNFKPVCQLANYQNKGLFDLCYGVPSDDAPRNQTALVRCIFTLALSGGALKPARDGRVKTSR